MKAFFPGDLLIPDLKTLKRSGFNTVDAWPVSHQTDDGEFIVHPGYFTWKVPALFIMNPVTPLRIDSELIVLLDGRMCIVKKKIAKLA